jgi:hypothetical protein
MTDEVGIRNSEFGIPTHPPPDLEVVGGGAAHSELGMRNEELGIPTLPLYGRNGGGWAANLKSEIRNPKRASPVGSGYGINTP